MKFPFPSACPQLRRSPGFAEPVAGMDYSGNCRRWFVFSIPLYRFGDDVAEYCGRPEIKLLKGFSAVAYGWGVTTDGSCDRALPEW